MELYIDFNSDEAIYVQLCNQIIMGIATNRIQDGESLPSVRTLADTIGINMHTVNKAYGILKQQGFVKVDRRRGAVVSVDPDRVRVLEQMKKELAVPVATCILNGVSRTEAHQLLDELYDRFIKVDTQEQ